MTASHRFRSESGAALFAAITLLAVMFGLGLALLAIVDTQTDASATQRKTDSSFNLAEGALNSAAFLLARSWPSTSSATTGVCAAAASTPSGTLAAVATASSFSDRIQDRLRGAFRTNPRRTSSGDYADTSTWKVNVCDNAGGGTVWSDALLSSNVPYDANKDGFLWVRAQARTATRSRAVAALVAVDQRELFPRHFAAVVGSFEEDLETALSGVTGSAAGTIKAATAGQLLQQSSSPSRATFMRDASDPDGGQLGLRCGVLSGCVSGALTAVNTSATVLPGATGGVVTLDQFLGANKFVQYGSETVMSSEDQAALLRQAKDPSTGVYLDQVADGAECLPSGANGKVVYIARVGSDGKGRCKITSSTSSLSPKALVVQAGRIGLTGGSSSGSIVNLNTVVYAMNQQGTDAAGDGKSDPAVVTISDYGRITGAVFIDRNGKLSITPPAFSSSALVESLIPDCTYTTGGTASSNNVVGSLASGVAKNVTIAQGALTTLGKVVQSTVTLSTTIAANPICTALKTALKSTGSAALVDKLVNGGTVTVSVPVSVTSNQIKTLVGSLVCVLNLTCPTVTVDTNVSVDVTVPSLAAATGGLSSVAVALASSLAGANYGPVVQQGFDIVRAVTGFASSGTVAATFREIQPY